jgi:hypothetical protein
MIRYHIANSAFILCGLLMVVKVMYITSALAFVPTYLIALAGFFPLLYKHFLRSKYPSMLDPLLQNRIPSILFYSGMGAILAGLATKFLLMPEIGFYMLILACVLEFFALLLSLVIKPSVEQKSENDDILDME